MNYLIERDSYNRYVDTVDNNIIRFFCDSKEEALSFSLKSARVLVRHIQLRKIKNHHGKLINYKITIK